ncbi:MAG: ErfK/YbiS/YcfS/YnhG family protein, partial [Patescibacteria group bacterium]|nr:ErfK/YbiS/YcfS/YnhG family protein [Patescibacteria group bacterium]
MSRKFLLFAALLALFLVVLVGGSLSGVAYAYRDTFYPGVKVAGIDLSGKTEAEGKALVSERVKQYVEHPIKIVIPDISKPLADSPNQYEMEELSTTAGSLGLKFAGDEAVASAWSLGHGRNLIQWVQGVVPALFEGSKRSVAYSVDSNAINTYVNATVVPKIGAPVPAKIVINGTEVGVEQSKPGFEVDQDQLRKMLAKALDSAADKDPSYLQAPVTITESSVTKKSLQPVADKWNSLGDVKISLTMDGSTITPKRADLLKWFSAVQNEQGEVSLVADKDAIGQYLAK